MRCLRLPRIKVPYQDLLLTHSEGAVSPAKAATTRISALTLVQLHLAKANGSPQQLWHLQYFGILQSGTYNIINAIQRRALDSMLPTGERIIAYPLNSIPHGTDNQKVFGS